MSDVRMQDSGGYLGTMLAVFAAGLIAGGAAVYEYKNLKPRSAPTVTTVMVPGQRIVAERPAPVPPSAAKTARFQDNGQPPRTGMDANAVPQPKPPVPPATTQPAQAPAAP